MVVLCSSFAFYFEKNKRVFILFYIVGLYHIITNITFFSINNVYFKQGLVKKYNYDAIKSSNLYDSKSYKFLFFSMKDKCISIILKNGKKLFYKMAI